MSIDFSTFSFSHIVWVFLAVVGVIIAIVVLRFFWKHILKYIFQGCLVLVVIIALLALLHYYFKIF